MSLTRSEAILCILLGWILIASLLAFPLHGQDASVAPAPPAPEAEVTAQDSASAPPADPAQVAPADPAQGPTSDDATGPEDSGASFQTFYDSLSTQGTWIQTQDYGYVWQPQVSDPDWAPYTAGRWVYTDDGWTWISDESFGWATYHYGRWVNLDGTGWVWVPGYTWAPAWVSWRYGDGYAGWAPLPPDSFAGIDYYGEGYNANLGYHIGGDCDGYYGIGPALYIFLPVTYLCYPHYHDYYCHRHDNFGLINRTTNVTNINLTHGGGGFSGHGHGGRVTTGGPQLGQVNAVSSTPFQRLGLVHSRQPSGGTIAQNSVSLYAPRVRPTTTHTQPAQISGSLGRTSINHGADITRPVAVNARIAPAPPNPAQVEAARTALGHAPASAKVLTDASTVKPVFQAPLTSLHPAVAPARTTPPSLYAPAPGSIYPTSPSGHAVFAPRQVPATTPGSVTPSQHSVLVPANEESDHRPASGQVYPSPSAPNRSVVVPEVRTYVRPSAPANPAPVERPAPAPVQHSAPPTSASPAGESGGGHSSGGGGSPAPTSNAGGNGDSGHKH